MIDYDMLSRMINGSLKNCIKVHGPITKEFLSSATKRVTGQIIGHIHTELKHEKLKELSEEVADEFVVIEKERLEKLRKAINGNRQGLVYWKAKAHSLNEVLDEVSLKFDGTVDQ